MMEYCRYISVSFLFLLLSLCIVDKTTGNNQIAFEEFSKMHESWLQIISNADIDLMLRESLFSYGLSESTNTTLVSAYIQKLKHSTDPMLNLNSPLLPSRIKCTIDILYTIENVEKEWALQMLDSAGKIPSGMFKGNVLWTGNYRECLEIYAPPESVLNISFGNFRGQYCIASWTINISSSGYPPIPIKSSLCVPDTCSASTIEEDIRFLSSFLDLLPYVEKYTSMLSLNSFTCTPRSISLDRPAISLLILLGILGIIILLGSLITVVEFYKLSTKEKRYIKLEYDTKETWVEEDTFEEPQNTSCEESLISIGERDNANDDKITFYEGRKHKMSVQKHSIFPIPNSCIGIFCCIKRILKCFCVFTNGSKIFNTSSSQQRFLCIHGIRFLSMMWVILIHSGLLLVRDLDNIVDFIHDIEYWPYQFVLQGSFAGDSFFLLSGFLVTYQFLVYAKSSKRKMNWLYFYIHRYWRLTPVYLLVLGFNTAIYRYLGSGPFWDDEATESAVCRKNWWWNLLYINNFLDYSEMCAKWSWYLAADMQFYVISPLFSYFLCRWPKIGLSVISGLLGLSWIITGWISAKYEVLPFFFSVRKDVNLIEYKKLLFDSANLIYYKPYCRIGPYLIGAILAFLVLKAGDNKNFLKIWQQVLGWCSAAFFSLSVIFDLYHVETNRTLFDFYNALSRSSFSLCPAWVIFACLTGHGGFVNKILSLKLWIPLSRLTYCAYIVHSLLLTYYYQTLQIPIHFTHITMMIYFLAFSIWSYGFAFILSVAFESPMMNLEKLIVKRNS